DPPLRAAAAVSDCDAAGMISATLALAFLWERQGKVRPALPQVIVDGTLEVSETWCSWLVCAHLDGQDLGRRGRECREVDGGCIFGIGLCRGRVASNGVELQGLLAEGR